MPESWLNNATRTANITGFRYLRLNRGAPQPRLRGALVFPERSRAAWEAEQHDEEQERRDRRDPDLPPPLRLPEVAGADQVVADIGQYNSEHDIELEEGDHATAPARWCDLRDVHRTEHGGAADRQSDDEAEAEQ